MKQITQLHKDGKVSNLLYALAIGPDHIARVYNRTLRNEFIIIISNNSHTSLFGNTMNRTNPSTISNRIDYTCIEKLKYLISDRKSVV